MKKRMLVLAMPRLVANILVEEVLFRELLSEIKAPIPYIEAFDLRFERMFHKLHYNSEPQVCKQKFSPGRTLLQRKS